MIKSPISLVNRITIWFTLSSLVLIVVATTSLYWSLANTLDNEDQLLLLDKIQTLDQLLTHNNNPGALRNRVETEWAARRFEQIFVKLVTSDGKTITETPDFGTYFNAEIAQSPKSFSGDLENKLRQLVVYTTSSNGRIFKYATLVLSGNFELIILLDRTDEANLLALYRSRLLLVLFVVAVLSVVLGRQISKKGIQPVIDIVNTIETITSSTLHKRINLENVPNELAVLVRTFNQMLDRLDESFNRLSRFSQDIAHELRTPVHNIQGELEVALGRVRSLDEYQNILGSCLEECSKLGRLIDSLLFLARSENPSGQLSIAQIHLKSEVTKILDFFSVTAKEAQQVLINEISDDIFIQADALLFQRAFVNLISNSLRYSKRSGTITVSAQFKDKIIQIKVVDTGIGISSEHLPHVFDRFYRVDPSRSDSQGGTGLGLSIVQGIMNLHKGHATIESHPGAGVTVSLEFPS